MRGRLPKVSNDDFAFGSQSEPKLWRSDTMRSFFILALAACAGSAFGDLVAHWRFDEPVGSSIANDSAGTYYGTLQGQAAFAPGAGVAGGAISLHRATNDLVNMGNILNLNNTSFTISLWMKTTDPADSYPLAKHRSGVVAGWIVAIGQSGGSYGQPNKPWFYNGNFPGQEVNAQTVVNDGEWHHVCVVFVSGVQKRIYVDGTPAEGTNVANGFSAIDASLLVGGIDIGGNPTGLFEGMVDDIQIYDRPFSDFDVDYLYQNPGQSACGADFNRDTILNFFDVQAFLQAFSNHESRADMNQDGLFDFFDAQAFLAAFSAGCA